MSEKRRERLTEIKEEGYSEEVIEQIEGIVSGIEEEEKFYNALKEGDDEILEYDPS